MEFDSEDKELLIKLSTSFEMFLEEWEDVKENGFRFCSASEQRITGLEKSFAWFRGFIISLLVAAITAGITYILEDNGHAQLTETETWRYLFDGESDGAESGDQAGAESLVEGQQ